MIVEGRTERSDRIAHPVRILVVDDVTDVRNGLRTVLPLVAEAAGLALEIVGESANGADAVRLAALLQPDIILLDLAMPGVDGYVAAQAIRARCPGAKLVALTIHADEAWRTRAERTGFDAFIEKGPPALVQIVTVIRDFTLFEGGAGANNAHKGGEHL